MSDKYATPGEVDAFLLGFFRSDFIATDNLPRDIQEENRIITKAKASFLLYATLKDSFYIQTVPKNGHLLLEPEYGFHFEFEYYGEEYNFLCTDVVLFTRKFAEENRHSLFDLKAVAIFGPMCSIVRNDPMPQHKRYHLVIDRDHSNIRIHSKAEYYQSSKLPIEIIGFNEAFKKFYQKVNLCSIFDICKKYGKNCDNQSEIFRRFNINQEPFTPLNHPNYELKKSQFDCDYKRDISLSTLLPQPSGEAQKLDETQELIAIDKLLWKSVSMTMFHYDLSRYLEKNYGNWKPLYSFKNEHGNANQKVIKIFRQEPQPQAKLLIPCSCWKREGYDEYFCVPYPYKKQPLYNLDLLLNEKKPPKVVILTDSIEIADINQAQSNNSGIVWTSWLPWNDYCFVDWSPLQGSNALIYCLITNHSDISLPEAYKNTGDLLSFFEENSLDIDLRFIQIRIDYSTTGKTYFHNVGELVGEWKERPPQKIDRSIKVMSRDEFNRYHERALLALIPVPEFWEDPRNEPQQERQKSKIGNGKKKAIDYLIRPIITRGDLTILHAKHGMGKSALALSLCASIVTGKRIFKNKWWIPISTKKKCPGKVLFIDYRHGPKRLATLKTDFIDPYLPDRKPRRNERCGNMFFVDAKSELRVDPQKEPDHKAFLELINKKTNEGTLNHPVDFVVFDGMVDSGAGWEKTKKLFDKIRAKGVAILLILYSDGKGESKEFQKKEKDASAVISLNLPEDYHGQQCPGLETPRLVKIQTSTDNHIFSSSDAFRVKFDFENGAPKGKKSKRIWQADGVDDKEMMEEFLRLKHQYMKVGHYDKIETAKMLGMSDSTMYEYEKKYKKELQEVEASEKR